MNSMVVYNISLTKLRCQILLFMHGMPGGMENFWGRVVIAHLVRSVQDVGQLVGLLPATAQVGRKRWLRSQSVGAVLVATWVHDYAPAIRGWRRLGGL
ncbi:hypothetical protein ACLK1S_08795 [Escherichia coli]